MGKRVLVVDDTIYMRALIKDTLAREGYEIVGEAADGETAIDLAYSLKPDLITLDNVLPDMLGVEVLGAIKKSGKLSSKILIISAVGQETMKKKCFDLGASGYLVKPFSSENLIKEATRIVSEAIAA